MSKTSVLRLIIPEWHGGVNPNYVFGSELLAHIAPANKNDEVVRIAVKTSFDEALDVVEGIDGGNIILNQMKETKQVLNEKQPEKVVVFGGDCSVTQVPFEYLKQKYGDELGIIWLDAHPDICGTAESSHLHEMVLANLLGQNQDSEITQVKNPFATDKVILAGLIEERLREMDKGCKRLGLKIASPQSLKEGSQTVMDWVKTTGIKYVAVHWDLDVLSPTDFRSIYPAEPYTEVEQFPAAVGSMTLGEVSRLLNDVSAVAEIIGISITEHLPWDAISLRKTLSSISIFND